MSLPLGQPPVSGLSPQLQGGAWSTAFRSGVCPHWGIPAPALVDMATPRSVGSHQQLRAQEVLPRSCFSCGNNGSWGIWDPPPLVG